MRWFSREASLVTALVALVLVAEPGWLAPVSRLWLVAIALLGSGAILSTAFDHIPTELAPSDSATSRQLGDIRQMRDIEQANDFLLAVDFQLYPFLQNTVLEIAAQRLLAHHNVALDHEPERARRLLGEEAWHVITAADENRWHTVSLDQLVAVADALEKV